VPGSDLLRARASTALGGRSWLSVPAGLSASRVTVGESSGPRSCGPSPRQALPLWERMTVLDRVLAVPLKARPNLNPPRGRCKVLPSVQGQLSCHSEKRTYGTQGRVCVLSLQVARIPMEPGFPRGDAQLSPCSLGTLPGVLAWSRECWARS